MHGAAVPNNDTSPGAVVDMVDDMLDMAFVDSTDVEIALQDAFQEHSMAMPLVEELVGSGTRRLQANDWISKIGDVV